VTIVHRAVKFTSGYITSKKGRSSVCDEERSGRPSASRTENSIQAIERTVRENGRITVDDTAEASVCLA
jgi:hypothetical protein